MPTFGWPDLEGRCVVFHCRSGLGSVKVLLPALAGLRPCRRQNLFFTSLPVPFSGRKGLEDSADKRWRFVMFCVVAYDIPDNRRRTKVMKLLEGYGGALGRACSSATWRRRIIGRWAAICRGCYLRGQRAFLSCARRISAHRTFGVGQGVHLHQGVCDRLTGPRFRLRRPMLRCDRPRKEHSSPRSQ